MNIYDNYDGNDKSDATFMEDRFVEDLPMKERLSPKLKALAAAGLIGLASLWAVSCAQPNKTPVKTEVENDDIENEIPEDKELGEDMGDKDNIPEEEFDEPEYIEIEDDEPEYIEIEDDEPDGDESGWEDSIEIDDWEEGSETDEEDWPEDMNEDPDDYEVNDEFEDPDDYEVNDEPYNNS